MPAVTDFQPGTLVRARGRTWVVLPSSDDVLLQLRPLGGSQDETAGVLRRVEKVRLDSFAPPTLEDLGDSVSAGLLRSALRIGFRSGAGPFRSLASLAVEPRPYQLVPLLMALRMETVRLLIADDVGVGKTIEAGLIAAELLAQGDAKRLAVLCSPHLADQWQEELRSKFHIDAEVVLASTWGRLERNLPWGRRLFQHYRHVIVSTELVKNPERRKAFLRDCPDLVIVDEAHSCVADPDSRRATVHQRYELLKGVAADPTRHLILATATPHSGKPGAFQNLLGLLDEALPGLVDSKREADARRVARHMIQRRRAHIRSYLEEDTPFPERLPAQEYTYRLTPAYAELLRAMLRYAQGLSSLSEEAGEGDGGPTVEHRVLWWSLLSMLQAMASSPPAAAATLRARAATADADTVEEADELGRRLLLDLDAEATVEADDTVPGSVPDDTADDADAQEHAPGSRGAQLRGLARLADRISPANDAKLQLLIKEVARLVDEGHDPIVFCRYIPTADYVAKELAKALGRRKTKVTVASVTGVLPPAVRETEIAKLADADAERRVLVATDCLSEGINLQEHFDAVIHYDLAWNPTRHEQREGRVDRFGQRRPTIHVGVIYGSDNRIDALVLDVLLRKHEAIRRSTGVSVPVPGDGGTLLGVIAERLLMSAPASGQDTEQLTLEFAPEDEAALRSQTDDLHGRWDDLAAQEVATRSRLAHLTIDSRHVAEELAEVRAALGPPEEVAAFTRSTLAALDSGISPTDGGFTATTDMLPAPIRDTLPPRHSNPLPFRSGVPVPRGEAGLVRTDPVVAAIAQYVLDGALDTALPGHRRPASRCGVIKTDAVTRRTVLLLVRFRFTLALPSRSGPRPVISEDVQLLAYRSADEGPEWLPQDEVPALLSAAPTVNPTSEQVHRTLKRALADLETLTPVLNERAQEYANQLLASHRKIRQSVEARVRGLDVTPLLPPDVLGVYVYLPAATGGIQ